jgi:hypothetical protein
MLKEMLVDGSVVDNMVDQAVAVEQEARGVTGTNSSVVMVVLAQTSSITGSPVYLRWWRRWRWTAGHNGLVEVGTVRRCGNGAST